MGEETFWFFNVIDMMPFNCYAWRMPFPEGMQLTLLELALVLKYAIYFFFMATEAQHSENLK